MDQHERGHYHVRANAFASRFLMPMNGIERYLQSIGRDAMAQGQGAGPPVGYRRPSPPMSPAFD